MSPITQFASEMHRLGAEAQGLCYRVLTPDDTSGRESEGMGPLVSPIFWLRSLAAGHALCSHTGQSPVCGQLYRCFYCCVTNEPQTDGLKQAAVSGPLWIGLSLTQRRDSGRSPCEVTGAVAGEGKSPLKQSTSRSSPWPKAGTE